MIMYFQTTRAELDRYRFGPRGPHLDCFARWLSDQGYANQTGLQKMRLVAFWGRWLGQKHIRIQELDEQRIADFRKAQRKALLRHHEVQRTLTQLLHCLRRATIIPEPQPRPDPSLTDRLLHEYGQFLTQARGLSQTTLLNYLPEARRFLESALGAQALCLDSLTVQHINRFVLHDRAAFSPKRVQLSTTVLRSFLGFLYLPSATSSLTSDLPPTSSGSAGPVPRWEGERGQPRLFARSLGA